MGSTYTLACSSQPELFFAEHEAQLEAAKAICSGCAVSQMCLAGALARAEPYGVWGGQVVIRGRVVDRKRGRGRPRTVA